MRIILLLILCVCSTTAELFSSTVMLRKAVEAVKTFDMREHIKLAISKNETKRSLLQPALDHLDELNILVNGPEFRIQHPVFAYKFIRLQVRASMVTQSYITRDQSFKDTRMDWHTFEHHLQMVSWDDLVGIVAGVARIQHTYQLNTANLVDGQVGEFPSLPLSAAECLDFADIVRNIDIDINTLAIAKKWLNEAKKKVAARKDNTTDILKILNVYEKLYVQSGCECTAEAGRIYYEIQDRSPGHFERKPPCKANKNAVCKNLTTAYRESSRTRRFHALCRQDPVTLPPEKATHRTAAHRLSCRYVHNGDPRLLLQPVKLEELNTIRPYIAMLHNIITDGEIDFIKATSPSSFKRGTVFTKKGQAVTKTKISQTTILPWKYMRHELKALRGRLQAVTQLNMKGFERITVANYGIGGHYGFHVDLVNPKTDPDFSSKNNRLLSMVMYLTDVEAGGQTCFPDIGVSAAPEKGSILLFRNLFRNGTGVSQSTHTSCPVMVGEKWIAVQWVRVFHQLFDFPCSLDSNE